MTLFDFFNATELPVPAINSEAAARIAATDFGLTAAVRELGSQQDANFLLIDDADGPFGVLKIANPAFTRIELEAQDAAAAFIDAAEDIRTATNIGTPAIADIDSGGKLFARIIRFLPGGTLSGDRYLRPAQVAALGDLAGRTCRALAAFDHPGVDRVLQWDLRHAMRTVEVLAPHIADPARRQTVESAAAAAWQVVAGLAEDLPVQVIHGDITGDNVVVTESGIPDGLIDFGDLMRSWTVAELAVAVTTLLRHDGCEPSATLPAIQAFHAVRPLSPAELDVLWPLVVIRSATLVVSGIHQSSIDAENAYASSALDHEWRIFERANAIPITVMAAQIRHALGVARPAEPVAGRLIDGHAGEIVVLDLSAEADAMDGGAWLDPDCEARLAAEALAAGATAVATAFGQARLTRAGTLSSTSPATVATGVEVWSARPLTVVAPWEGTVAVDGDTVSLTGSPGTLELRGAVRAAAGTHSAEAGAALAGVDGAVWIQVRRPGAGAVPDFVRPEYAAGWLAQVSDPAPLLGLPPAVGHADDSAVARSSKPMAAQSAMKSRSEA